MGNRLLPFSIHDLRHATSAPCKLRALPPDEMPRKLENSIHALQTLSSRLRQEEIHPGKSYSCHTAEEHHGPARSHAQEHQWHGFGVTVLVDEVERHGDGTTQGTQTKRIDFRIKEVLHAIPSQSLWDGVSVCLKSSIHDRGYLPSRNR